MDKIEMKINTIYNENCLDTMARMPDGFIDLTVTSPPYAKLRPYKGNNESWNEGVWKAIIKELFRVTKQGGVVVWVVGDATVKGSETGVSFKQALWAIECGFNLYDTMIYAKGSGGLPHKGRYTGSFEYMFVMSKGRITTFNPIYDRENKSFGRETGKKTVRDQNGVLTTRKSLKIKQHGIRFNIWEYFNGNGVGQTDKIAYGHPATFPEKLANDHILSWSNENDLVYDPFMGSGTTAKMAKLLNRNFIGSELESEYCDIANERIAKLVPMS